MIADDIANGTIQGIRKGNEDEGVLERRINSSIKA
jgi:hypothetical protein